MARPFQAATTLSSRAGRSRSSRASRSRRWQSNHRSSVLRVLAQLQGGGAVLERAGVGDRQQAGRPRPVVGAEHLDQLVRCPDVERALGALGVRVEGGGEAALGCPELPEQEVGDALGRPDPHVGAPGGVDAQQLGVVVEHLLEVRHHPVGIDAVAGEAAAELVVDPATGHRLQRPGRHRQGTLGAVPEQELQHHGRRELRGATETAALGVVLLLEQRDRSVEDLPVQAARGAGRPDDAGGRAGCRSRGVRRRRGCATRRPGPRAPAGTPAGRAAAGRGSRCRRRTGCRRGRARTSSATRRARSSRSSRPCRPRRRRVAPRGRP